MSAHDDPQLEARVRQELEALGELSAPPALANRIMQVIEQRNAAPWHRRAWPTWPRSLRLASFVMLLSAFAGLCFGAFALTRTIFTLESTSNCLTVLQALWRTIGVLGEIISTFPSQLGTGVLVTGLFLLLTAGALCIGLTSACVRLALRPATNRI